MPTKAVAAETMEIGKKGGGKHWTAKQKAARESAAQSVKRAEVIITAPDYLSSGALAIWKRVVDDARELGDGSLLDNLDTDMLASYCDAVNKAQILSKKIDDGDELRDDDDIKILQGWYRVIASYAEKLGFTPQARARLVKKRSDEDLQDAFGKSFDG